MSVVKYHPTTREFLIEEAPAPLPEPELSVEELRLRIAQQQMLADFGVIALRGTPFPELLQEATRVAAAVP